MSPVLSLLLWPVLAALAAAGTRLLDKIIKEVQHENRNRYK